MKYSKPMRFIKVKSQETAEDFLFKEISSVVKKYDQLTWLISGGSNVNIAASVFKRLDDVSLGKITIMLTDERYGKPGHADSNYTQLSKAGINFGKVKNYPVLSGNLDLQTTTSRYLSLINSILEESNFTIGQLGIGQDGHTAGILPHSPVAKLGSESVVSYDASDFQRITLSFDAIKRLSSVLVFALGQGKQQAIKDLRGKELPLEVEPAQIFKQLTNVYIINDMIGDGI
jgi:6-phosphogluconolactonase/glucosamine-6-phosphate isomerase/deaminase